MCSVSGTWTQSKHLVNQTTACFLSCLWPHLPAHQSKGSYVLFISAPAFLSRLQPYGTEPRQRDKHLSMTTPPPISIHLCARITPQVLSSILGGSDSHLPQQFWAYHTQSALLKIEEFHWGSRSFFFLIFFAGRLMQKALKPQLTNDLFPLIAFSLSGTLSWARTEKMTRTCENTQVCSITCCVRERHGHWFLQIPESKLNFNRVIFIMRSLKGKLNVKVNL